MCVCISDMVLKIRESLIIIEHYFLANLHEDLIEGFLLLRFAYWHLLLTCIGVISLSRALMLLQLPAALL